MKAMLRTMCGCTQIVDLDVAIREIRVPLRNGTTRFFIYKGTEKMKYIDHEILVFDEERDR